ncbi:nitrate reductase cytochrome c-type subunit [Enterovibrio sp. ZSDZ35]|uniref:Periplasmic nitrate reductase, electron transfer subunit n=1 Tax=Enterovibrio qingdaonensis TaxID=2899818 RepID=A0ABT5QIQ2_9GAMM|nr:nitrate reductase cytochrome c-type subunit [Enterovibrio sp. ZSDZ35]MDD1780861.1 nitrate reductase cytochrome c-type subunit [Enterovibrio sp. ZSDZ35]
MKSKKAVSLLLSALIGVAVYANVVSANTENVTEEAVVVESLRGTTGIEEANVVPDIKNVPKNQERIALNYVNQPPMIPHSIDGYQVNQANNSCLECHDVDVYRKTGAPRISPTHFMDRDNRVLTEVSARRYFCLQCHVPQAQTDVLVENDFVPAGKFGQ